MLKNVNLIEKMWTATMTELYHIIKREISCEISGGTRSAALNELGLLLAQGIGCKYMVQLMVAGMGTAIRDR